MHSTAFGLAIKRELGAEIDFDQVSLENARYGQPDLEEAFAEFLAKRLAKWQPDLVVPAGAPAGLFVAKFRDRLFPGTPVIYSWVDKRTLPADAITNNATFVGTELEIEPAGGGHAPARPGDEPRRGDPRGDAAGAVLGRGIPEGIRAVRRPDEVHVRKRPAIRADAGPGVEAATPLVRPDGAASARRVGGHVQPGRSAQAAERGVAGAGQRDVSVPGGPWHRGGTAVSGRVHGPGDGPRGGADPARRAHVRFRPAGDSAERAHVRLARAEAQGDQRKPAAAGECRAVPSTHHLGTISAARHRGCGGHHDAGSVDLRAARPAPAATRRRGRPRPRGGRRAAEAGRAGAHVARDVAGGADGGAGARVEPAADRDPEQRRRRAAVPRETRAGPHGGARHAGRHHVGHAACPRHHRPAARHAEA